MYKPISTHIYEEHPFFLAVKMVSRPGQDCKENETCQFTELTRKISVKDHWANVAFSNQNDAKINKKHMENGKKI